MGGMEGNRNNRALRWDDDESEVVREQQIVEKDSKSELDGFLGPLLLNMQAEGRQIRHTGQMRIQFLTTLRAMCSVYVNFSGFHSKNVLIYLIVLSNFKEI